MQNKIRGNKGFTLAELAIALSVGAIVLAMLALSIFYLHKAFYNSDYVNNSLTEYNSVKTQICDAVASWQEQGLEVKRQSENSVAGLNMGEQKHIIQNTDNSLALDGEQLLTFNYISSLGFFAIGGNIVVKVVFTNNEQMQFII